jgi:hypothetical protein
MIKISEKIEHEKIPLISKKSTYSTYLKNCICKNDVKDDI